MCGTPKGVIDNRINQINNQNRSIMKTIINKIRKSGTITQECMYSNRQIMNFYNTNEGLWSGARRYAH